MSTTIDEGTSTLVWQDPPPPGGAAGRTALWPQRLAPFMANPGKWGIVHTYSNASTASSLKKKFREGVLRVPDGTAAADFEFVGRKNDDGKFDVYCRYLGG